jgi:hypothetical protein
MPMSPVIVGLPQMRARSGSITRSCAAFRLTRSLIRASSRSVWTEIVFRFAVRGIRMIMGPGSDIQK